MSDNINITLTANSNSVEQALQKLGVGLDRTVDKLNVVAKASTQSAKAAEDGFSKATGRVTEFVQSFTGVGSAMSGMLAVAVKVSAEFDKIVKLQEKARSSASAGADVARQARLSMAGDGSVRNEDVEREFERISHRTGMDVNSVGRVAAEAFSAGARSDRDALTAVEAAARLTPGNEGAANTMAVRAIHLANLTGQQDPKANIGSMVQVAQATTIKDQEKLGAALLPAMTASMAFGDNEEQARELFTTLNYLTQDVMGSDTSTGQINFAKALGTYAPTVKGSDKQGKFRIPKAQIEAFKAAVSNEERMAVLQASPELSRDFIGNTSFEAKMFAPIKALLENDPKAAEAQRRAREQITPVGPEMTALYESKLKQLDSGPFSPIRDIELKSASNTDEFARTATYSQRVGAARKILTDTQEAAGIGMGAFDRALNFEAPVALGRSPEEAAKRTLQYYKQGVQEMPETADSKRIEQLLEKQISLLDSQLKEMQRSDSGFAPSSPGRPPAARPSARLGRSD